MPIRKIIFWSHLVAGVGAGLFILLMSATGLLLTYEKNMVNSVRNSAVIVPTQNARMLSLDELIDVANGMDRQGASLSISRNPAAPIVIQQRGQDPVLLNPYTGEAMSDPAHALDSFFGTVTHLHRWLAMTGERRSTGRAITGAANLIFLFIVISGLYLWLPKIWRWSFIRLNLLFRRKLPNSKARDYNWHHVFGVWALVPLFFIVISGAVISYPWAGNLIYKIVGEDPPQRGGPRGGAQLADAEPAPIILNSSVQDGYDAVIRQADDKWTSSRIGIPKAQDATVSITLNYGSGVVAKYSESFTFDREKSSIVTVRNSRESSRGQKLRRWFRFVHTGEHYGFIGQTVAGLATLAACFLVYTGLALSFRRLIMPLFRRRKLGYIKR